MAKSRKFLTVGALGVAAFALIGAGASATFTDAVHADQSIKAGTLNMRVTGPAGSTTDGKTVTLKAVGPVNSTFTTGPQTVITTNSGDITASAIKLSASATGTNRLLLHELYVEIDSSGTVVYKGPLAGLQSAPITISGDVPAGTTDPFDVTFYAGTNGAPSLSNPSQGGVVVPTITVEYTG
jgi:predicted ribosomally synthesized peptide with SipW-like signal peptide